MNLSICCNKIENEREIELTEKSIDRQRVVQHGAGGLNRTTFGQRLVGGHQRIAANLLVVLDLLRGLCDSFLELLFDTVCRRLFLHDTGHQKARTQLRNHVLRQRGELEQVNAGDVHALLQVRQ